MGRENYASYLVGPIALAAETTTQEVENVLRKENVEFPAGRMSQRYRFNNQTK